MMKPSDTKAFVCLYLFVSNQWMDGMSDSMWIEILIN